jgi:hypothetical protein
MLCQELANLRNALPARAPVLSSRSRRRAGKGGVRSHHSSARGESGFLQGRKAAERGQLELAGGGGPSSGGLLRARRLSKSCIRSEKERSGSRPSSMALVIGRIFLGRVGGRSMTLGRCGTPRPRAPRSLRGGRGGRPVAGGCAAEPAWVGAAGGLGGPAGFLSAGL